MASIHGHPNSRFWYCTIGIPGRGQLQRTTKQTDRRKAYLFAQKFETAARGNALTDIAARKILSEIYAIHNQGEQLAGSKAREFFQSWVENKKRETAPSTGSRYASAINSFIKSLGPRADIDISAITARDVVKFRDAQASRLSASTANDAVKIVRMALKDAQAQSLVTANVAVGVRPTKSTEESARRRPFTLPEIKRLLSVAQDEWVGMILFGLYTGQRIGDIARLTWQNIDLERGELALVSRKTKRRVVIPLAAPPQAFLLEHMDTGDDPKQPLFPRAFAAKRISSLSNAFYQIMADAGLVEPRNHRSTGKGRSSRRVFNEVSFHCLRHTATSLMKNAGVPAAVVMDLIGHDSPAVSAHYTRIEEETKRRAVGQLPDVTKK
jgi:integrase